MGFLQSKEEIDPEELMRLMDENTDVVIQYYNSRREHVERYIVENFWEEDVERWLDGIRNRSPLILYKGKVIRALLRLLKPRLEESLNVRRVDFLKKRNTEYHHTNLYENKSLVVRRAAQFCIDVYFDRPFDQRRDDLILSFGVGTNPSQAAGTKFICPVDNKNEDKSSWYCTSVPSTGNKLSLMVNVPANAIIGRYAVGLEITSGTSEGRKKQIHKDNSIVVLFNPFSQDDTVYMAEDMERKEYVMQDTGFIARGTFNDISKKNWHYAQFDEGVLDCVLKMITNDSRLINQPKCRKQCNDPVFVSRVLSAMVNCNDDNGVLWGRWDGNYKDGKNPDSWSDSSKILKQWSASGMKPVKYGQCWVFAGVLTTALRAIGIPARCITNFNSGHDTNANVTIDVYYDVDTGAKLDETSDSVWNFHVWNEGWFRRPDLKTEAGEYDGWQVVDATPQEVSEVDDVKSKRRELHQCGPAPVKAIKEGRILLGRDGNFIFGEVNADIVTWFVKDGKVVQMGERLSRSVGRNISTKAVGLSEIENVTKEYKYTEGSYEERKAFEKAYTRGAKDHEAHHIQNSKVLVAPKFKIEIKPAKNAVYVGSKVSAVVKIKNITDENMWVDVAAIGSTMRHTGATHARLKKFSENRYLEAKKDIGFTFEVEASEYLRKIVDYKIVNVRVFATDPQDGNTAVSEVDIPLKIPECLSVKVPGIITRGDVLKYQILFENKLPFKVTDGKIEISYRGCSPDEETFEVPSAISEKDTYTKDVSIQPLPCRRRIYGTINFECAEVENMSTSFEVVVLDKR